MHGHYLGQYVDGLRTPFIILPAVNDTPRHEYDDEYTIVLSDWYHDEHPNLMNEFLSPDSMYYYFRPQTSIYINHYNIKRL